MTSQTEIANSSSIEQGERNAYSGFELEEHVLLPFGSLKMSGPGI